MSELVLQLMALQVGVPLLLILFQAAVPAASRLGLALRAAALALVLVVAALAGVWLFPPFWTPYAMAVLVLLATSLSGRRLAQRGAARRVWLRRSEAGLAVATVVALVAIIAPAIQGREVPPGAVDLEGPLGPRRYLVTSGGTRETINAHLMTLGEEERFRPWRGQSHAVDLVGIDRWGQTARGVAPREPEAHVIYGAEVIAPCAGTVIEAVDGIADMPVPQMDREHMTGNHVLLACGQHAVLLAHMAPGSVVAAAGQEVGVGDFLGGVGNSAAPHLHIHVQRGIPEGEPIAGEPVLFTIAGRFLVRNDILTIKE